MTLDDIFKQATARPLTVLEDDKGLLCVCDADGGRLFTWNLVTGNRATCLATARLITIAVNHFEELVQELAALNDLDQYPAGVPSPATIILRTIKAEAEGDSHA